MAQDQQAEAGEEGRPGKQEVGGGELVPAEEEGGAFEAQGDHEEGQELSLGSAEAAAAARGAARGAERRQGDPRPLVLPGGRRLQGWGLKKSPRHRLRSQTLGVIRQDRPGSRPFCWEQRTPVTPGPGSPQGGGGWGKHGHESRLCHVSLWSDGPAENITRGL